MLQKQSHSRHQDVMTLAQFLRGEATWILDLAWIHLLLFLSNSLSGRLLYVIMLCSSQDGGARASLGEPWVWGRWMGRHRHPSFGWEAEECQPDHDSWFVTWQTCNALLVLTWILVVASLLEIHFVYCFLLWPSGIQAIGSEDLGMPTHGAFFKRSSASFHAPTQKGGWVSKFASLFNSIHSLAGEFVAYLSLGFCQQGCR